jgi:hypothetical protein
MKVLVLSFNHSEQIVPVKNEALIPDIVQNKARVRALVRGIIGSRKVDSICEESDPCHLSIAQQEGFMHDPRIPWKNINMTSQQRLEADIWEALLYRPYDTEFINDHTAIRIEYRIPEDDVREEFFKDEILKTASETGAKSLLVLCGDMHTEALATKLGGAGHEVQTNHDLTPERHWK